MLETFYIALLNIVDFCYQADFFIIHMPRKSIIEIHILNIPVLQI